MTSRAASLQKTKKGPHEPFFVSHSPHSSRTTRRLCWRSVRPEGKLHVLRSYMIGSKLQARSYMTPAGHRRPPAAHHPPTHRRPAEFVLPRFVFASCGRCFDFRLFAGLFLRPRPRRGGRRFRSGAGFRPALPAPARRRGRGWRVRRACRSCDTLACVRSLVCSCVLSFLG